MIPRELRERPQWVTWADERRNGRATKVPYSARTGRNASTTKPATWATFDETLSSYRADCGSAGIGFVFSADDPFVGIDLDGCRDPDTEKIEPWARGIIGRLDSYSEVSPADRTHSQESQPGSPAGAENRNVAHDAAGDQNAQFRRLLQVRLQLQPTLKPAD